MNLPVIKKQKGKGEDMAKWTRQDLVEFLEVLVEKNLPIHNNPHFRNILSRDQNLFINQNVREATGNVAYRTVDFDIDDLDDEQFWEKIETTEYQDLIEDNAAVALLKMAARFNLIN